jgi:hypothetical protein
LRIAYTPITGSKKVKKRRHLHFIFYFIIFNDYKTKPTAMRKLFFFSFAVALFSCNSGAHENTSKDTTAATNASTASASSSTQDVTYAYPITYSSKFEMGDPKKAQQVAQLWKDYDNNDLKSHQDAFADSITMAFPGMSIHAKHDSMMGLVTQSRSGYADVHSSIAAIMSTRSVDKNDDWVLVWGSEVTKSKAGKVDSSGLHEIWHFNKDGKVDFISQFRQSYPTKK